MWSRVWRIKTVMLVLKHSPYQQFTIMFNDSYSPSTIHVRRYMTYTVLGRRNTHQTRTLMTNLFVLFLFTSTATKIGITPHYKGKILVTMSYAWLWVVSLMNPWRLLHFSGIILFAMLNGRLPFNDAQLSELEEDMKMQRLRFEKAVSFGKLGQTNLKTCSLMF